jgi:iron(III) transport system ATP-binding protein
MVELADLHLTYPGASQSSVQGVSVAVAQGEFLTLLGPSGCGKTSTLRSIAGLERPTRGRISIGAQCVFDSGAGIEVPTHARSIAMVFQSYAIWPHMSVQENVEFPLRVMKLPAAEIRSRLGQALDMVGLAALRDRAATRLSGGQQQRVAIARALVRRADVMLLDEPLSNLDAKLREQMRLELRDLLKQVGMTAVYVTHDQEEALMLSDRIALMRAGKIVEIGTPKDLYLRPATLFGATFLGTAEIFQVRRRDAAQAHTDLGILQLQADAPAATHLAIRPEAIRVEAAADARRQAANVFPGLVDKLVFSGRQQQLAVRCDSGRVLNVLTDALRDFHAGQRVELELPACRLISIDEGTP